MRSNIIFFGLLVACLFFPFSVAAEEGSLLSEANRLTDTVQDAVSVTDKLSPTTSSVVGNDTLSPDGEPSHETEHSKTEDSVSVSELTKERTEAIT